MERVKHFRCGVYYKLEPGSKLSLFPQEGKDRKPHIETIIFKPTVEVMARGLGVIGKVLSRF